MAFEGLQLGLADSAGRVPRRNRTFTITEQRLNSSGVFVPTPVRFAWDSATQSSPRPSWKFGLKQRSMRTDYPGADEPTEQILGPIFKPFTIDGIWDDRYAGAGFAWGTHQAFEQLVARGNLVRIEFEELGITGLITDYDPEYVRKNYIKYAFTVSPHFREPGGIARTLKLQVPLALAQPEQIVRGISDAVDDATDFQNGLPGRMPSVFTKIQDVANSISSWISQIDDANQIIQNQFFGPIEQTTQALQRLAAQMRSVRNVSQDILDSVAAAQSDIDLAYVNAKDALDFEVWQRGIAYQARIVIGRSADAEDQFNARINPDVKALYRPHSGENLYAISNRFYNTPHNWRLIQQVNNLSYLTLTGLESLIIPDVH